ncbi:hypothetical protein FCI23_50620 [Actinacidiphila oryziradicis]|uniref:Uncharacterized protein n=2 Tax=Actinacidiphila oryziradicis TaxID=2571141 RepID=A0A4U0RNL2_9ACTN|nr:hypothetical protein FCI23_50620 [Actinacidiphila oryziradicis]
MLRGGPPGTTWSGPAMDARTLLLLTVVAVIIGYAAYRDPALGGAITVAAAVVSFLYIILKDDDDTGTR